MASSSEGGGGGGGGPSSSSSTAGKNDSGGNKGKSRVTLRLKEALGAKSPKSRNDELVQLTDQYNTFKKKIKELIQALVAHHTSMMHINKTRLDVARRIASISDKTPLFDIAGVLPKTPTNDSNKKDSPTSNTEESSVSAQSPTSYASIHNSMASRHKMYTDRYKQFILDYVIQWEKVVTNRISTSLKTAEKLRLDLDHYQHKVEQLRHNVNVTMAKGKQVDAKTGDKLQRNEEKLTKSRRDYGIYVGDLCVVMEEVTIHGWKDLHPLLVKMSQFDYTLAMDEYKMFGNMQNVTEVLKKISDRFGLKPQARLKEIETMTGDMILKDKGETTPPLMGANESYEVNHGAVMGSESTTTTMENNNMAMIPRTPSQSSLHLPPSTSDMVAIAAASAAPPTLDDLNDATSVHNNIPPSRSTSNGSLPPLSNTTEGRRFSFHEQQQFPEGELSSYNPTTPIITNTSATTTSTALTVAPPPAGAPPPPPPPPTLSMYSNVNVEVDAAADGAGSVSQSTSWEQQVGGGGGGGNTNPFDSPGGGGAGGGQYASGTKKTTTNPFGGQQGQPSSTNPFE